MQADQLTLTESCCGFLPGDAHSTSTPKPEAANGENVHSGAYINSLSSELFTAGDTADTTTQGALVNSYHVRPTDLAESSGDDTVEEGSSDNSDRRRRKRDKNRTVDLDKTPTQDSIDSELFLPPESGVNISIDDPLSSESAQTDNGGQVEKLGGPSTQNSDTLKKDQETNDPLAGLQMSASVYEHRTIDGDTESQT